MTVSIFQSFQIALLVPRSPALNWPKSGSSRSSKFSLSQSVRDEARPRRRSGPYDNRLEQSPARAGCVKTVLILVK